jgi:hypothetical protein
VYRFSPGALLHVQLKQAQLDWSLQHPGGTKDALEMYLKTCYQQYL